MSRLKDFLVIDTLRVHNIRIETKRLQASYTLTLPDGTEATKELIYSYEAPVFDPGDPAHGNLAALMAAQIALNYGLFCRKICLEGPYDKVDRKFLHDMLENTSREILTNKLLAENPFLLPGYQNLEVEKQDTYTAADLEFIPEEIPATGHSKNWPEPDYDQYAILSSGGKDSLLTYGLVREFGTAHPVFINESGRHWFSAVNAYRYFKEHEPNTAKPWCNSDRIFNWMLRQLPFIRSDFDQVRADIYPIRLWTVAVFLFGVLPVALKRGAGNILIGDEYDTSIRSRTRGISHYAGLYDQSRYFDAALTGFFKRKGWGLRQFSLLRSLSELLIMNVLCKRYPELQALQVSCHAAHETGGRMYPCGKCEKCRRIVGMMVALEADPGNCGYSPSQVTGALEQLAKRSVKQIGSDAAHLYHLLLAGGHLPRNAHTQKLARAHPEIMKLRFDRERSRLQDLPPEVRTPLFDILMPLAKGAVRKTAKGWEPVDWNADELKTPNYEPYEL